MTVLAESQNLRHTPPLPYRMRRDIWAACGWKPHSLQRRVLLSNARNQLASCGRRAGKSQAGGFRLIPEAFRAYGEQDLLERLGQRREYWIVGPEYSDSEKEFRVAWNGLSKLGFVFDSPGSYNNPLTGEMRISLFGGKFIIHAKSAKYPSTLVGEGLSGVVFSEAAKLKPSVYNKFIRPTLADFRGWTFFGSTPEGRNWFYDLWDRGQDETRTSWESWRAPSWTNPYVYPGGCDEQLLGEAMEAEKHGKLKEWLKGVQKIGTDIGVVPVGIDPEIWNLFMDMSGETFNQEIRALFTEFVGRVFKNYDEEYHVTDQGFRPDWMTYAAVDYGFTNPFVWLLIQVDPHKEHVHIVDEYYETHKTTEEAADEIQSRGLAPQSCRMFYPDPAEPDRTRVLARRLQVAPFLGGSISLADRLEWIRRSLKGALDGVQSGPARVPMLTINRKCREMRREFNQYRYPESAEKAAEAGRAAPEQPQKKDDHTPEALGRFYSGFFGSPWLETAGRQGKVKVRR